MKLQIIVQTRSGDVLESDEADYTEAEVNYLDKIFSNLKQLEYLKLIVDGQIVYIHPDDVSYITMQKV